jgi:hypothetical protein
MTEIHHRRRGSLPASLAEMVLLNRLRVHTRTDLELDMLRCGASVIELTAKHWFTDATVGRGRSFESVHVSGFYLTAAGAFDF